MLELTRKLREKKKAFRAMYNDLASLRNQHNANELDRQAARARNAAERSRLSANARKLRNRWDAQWDAAVALYKNIMNAKLHKYEEALKNVKNAHAYLKTNARASRNAKALERRANQLRAKMASARNEARKATALIRRRPES